jgi:type II secretory pathway component PulF
MRRFEETGHNKKEKNSTVSAKTALWEKVLAVLCSIGALLFYGGLYVVVPDYKRSLEALSTEIPVFTQVLLNIYQSYLMVFLLISVSILALFYIKSMRPGRGRLASLALIVFNFVFAAVLFGVTVLGTP